MSDISDEFVFIEGDVDISETIMGEYKYQHKRSQDYNDLLRRVYKWLGYDIRVWATKAHVCRAIPVDGDPEKGDVMKYIANETFIVFFDVGCDPDKALEELIASGFLPTPD